MTRNAGVIDARSPWPLVRAGSCFPRSSRHRCGAQRCPADAGCAIQQLVRVGKNHSLRHSPFQSWLYQTAPLLPGRPGVCTCKTPPLWGHLPPHQGWFVRTACPYALCHNRRAVRCLCKTGGNCKSWRCLKTESLNRRGCLRMPLGVFCLANHWPLRYRC